MFFVLDGLWAWFLKENKQRTEEEYLWKRTVDSVLSF